jgi:hypothetical protein
MGISSGFQFRFQTVNEVPEWNAHCLTERPQFNHVQPPFSGFTAADKRLMVLQAFGNLALRQMGLLTHIAQQAQEHVVLDGENGFLDGFTL